MDGGQRPEQHITGFGNPACERCRVIEAASALAHVWQLRDLSPDALAALTAATTVEAHVVDSVIVTQGEVGEDAFVVLDGRLEVRIDGPRGPAPVACLGPGELFGELAVLDPTKRRTASVIALTNVVLLRIVGDALVATIELNPDVRAQIDAASHRMAIARFIKGATLLTELEPETLARVAGHVRERRVAAGEVVIRQGEPGTECFLVHNGDLEVIDESGGSERRLAELRSGALFGEAALLTGAPRNATVRATTDTDLLVLHSEDILAVMSADRKVADHLVGMLQARSRPAQRPGVEMHPRTMSDGTEVGILKDRARGQYFWLSYDAMFLWERLDGRHTIRDLTIDLFREHQVLAPDMVMDVLHRLAAAGFVELAQVEQQVGAEVTTRRRWRRHLQPTFDRSLTIGGCDGFFTALYARGLHVLYTRWGAVCVALATLGGFACFLAVAPSVAGSLLHGGMFARAGVALLPLIGIAVLLHELGHGLAAKAAGAQVDRVGIGWYWFRPVVSVDTSDAWLASRERRMLVDAGGLIVNLLIAGLAGAVAYLAQRGSSTSAIAWIFALWSYIAVLRNLNPLLEYDGYYLLMDWLEEPNLRAHSLAWLGTALPGALRDRAQLVGHRLELLYGLGALAYIGVLTAWLIFAYRYTVQGWVAKLLPASIAGSVTELLAIAISIAALINLVFEIRKERANARGHARVS
jgi:putative peptide zinc metalloprotease protein